MTYNICYLLIHVFEALMFSYFCKKIFQIGPQKIKYYASLIGLYGLLFVVSFIKNPYINIISYILINFCFILLIVKAKWSSALLISIIVIVSTGLAKVVTCALTQTVSLSRFGMQLSANQLLLLTTINKLIYFLFLFIISQLFRSGIKATPITLWEFIGLSIVPILSSIDMLTLLVAPIYENTPSYLIAHSAIAVLIINITVFFLFDYRNQKEQELIDTKLLLQKENDSAQYYKLLLTHDENQKILIHDIKQHLSSLSTLISEKKSDRAVKYIESLLNLPTFKASPQYSNNDLLNAILSKYQKDFDENDITFLVDIRNNTLSNLSDAEISSLLGNLLENAFEAAKQCSKGIVELYVTNVESAGNTLITIKNTCTLNPFVNGSKLPRTTKSNCHYHGFGMKSIKNIIDKYHGVLRTYYESETQLFHTIIII